MGYKHLGYYQDGEYLKSCGRLNNEKPIFEIGVNGGKPKDKKYRVTKIPPYWKVNIVTKSQMYFPSLEESLMYVSMQE